jgi:subtilisin-like proprotein convertase family protein
LLKSRPNGNSCILFPSENDTFAVILFLKKLLPGMKQSLLIAGLILAGFSLFSQNDSRIAKTKTPLSQIEQAVMPLLDNKALLAAELERRALPTATGTAPKFAENIEVNISPKTHGHWDYLPNGNAVWRLRILSKGAKSLNLGFTKYAMPPGGTLVLYSPDYEHVMGPFTPADNEEHEQLWTPVLPGDELVLEVQVPRHSLPQLALELKYVNHDFLGFAEMLSGSCNLDVICGAADGWAIVDAYRDIIQSVALIGTGGSTFCTGFLVNNARQDCTPFFMTAFHCGINASSAPSMVAYWNFQNSTCRQPGTPASGGNGNGQLNNFNTGAIFRAGWQPSDFTLVELDDPISETANAFLAGWSAEDVAPSDTVICVHHPSTDEKRISFEFNPTLISDINGNAAAAGNFIKIPDWDVGTTEGGSSGAPLFNNARQIVGQLYGGLAACNNNSYDVFGWFKRSWTGGGTASTRLRDWLDPDNTGILVLDGRSQLQCSFFVEGTPANVSLCAPASAVYTIGVSESFTGDVTLSLSGLPDSLVAVFETNPIPPGGSTVLTISNTGALAAGNYIFQISGADGTDSTGSDLSLLVTTAVPGAVQLFEPGDEATGINLTTVFTWAAQPATTYTIEVATDENFTNILESAANLGNGSYQLGAPLDILTTYYWRVKPKNICGEGDWSETYSFTTGAVFCSPKTSTDVPKPISATGTPTITSTIQVNAVGILDDINVASLTINHTWVGDLEVKLTSPSGTTVTLMSYPGGGDCDNNNVQVFFDDESPNSYATLDGMCEPGPLAISGNFQPFEALSAFDGEPAAGTWTLTVHDDVDEDGGTLTGWGLQVCTIIPNDFSISPSATAFESCLEGEINFTVLLGTAFDDTGVTLTAENLPAGATAAFDPNPASPGDQVNVTVSGATESGSFTFDIVGDDGTNTGNTQIGWTVNGPPAAPMPVSPAQSATDVTLNKVFSWSNIAGATYLLEIATDAGMNDVIFSGVTANTSLNVTGLDYCTDYFWAVTATTACGTSDPSEVFAFTTVLDLAFDASPATVTVCISSQTSTTLSLGDCFETTGVTLEAVAPLGAFTFNFPVNPVAPGSDAVIEIIAGIVPGNYPVEITGNDGVNFVSEMITIQVKGPAAAPMLTQPANAAIGVAFQNPVFQWQSVSGATEYKFELATDDNFANIIHEFSLTQTTYNLPLTLAGLTTYYWRVTAFNNCGGTTPAAFSFTTETDVATFEIQGMTVSLLPNPTSGLIFLKFSAPAPEAMEVTIFAANGISVQMQRITAGSTSATFDLGSYPAGVYWLKLKSGKAVLTEKIILEK